MKPETKEKKASHWLNKTLELQAEIRELKKDRDAWREQAKRLASALEDRSTAYTGPR